MTDTLTDIGALFVAMLTEPFWYPVLVVGGLYVAREWLVERAERMAR